MKSSIQTATAVLGPELVKAFSESCRGNKREMEELIMEAMRALKFLRHTEDWLDDRIIMDQE